MYHQRLSTFTCRLARNDDDYESVAGELERSRFSLSLSLSSSFFEAVSFDYSIRSAGKRGKGTPKLEIASGCGVLVTTDDPCRAFSPPFETTLWSSGLTWRELVRVRCAGFSACNFAQIHRVFSKLWAVLSFFSCFYNRQMRRPRLAFIRVFSFFQWQSGGAYVAALKVSRYELEFSRALFSLCLFFAWRSCHPFAMGSRAVASWSLLF